MIDRSSYLVVNMLRHYVPIKYVVTCICLVEILPTQLYFYSTVNIQNILTQQLQLFLVSWMASIIFYGTNGTRSCLFP